MTNILIRYVYLKGIKPAYTWMQRYPIQGIQQYSERRDFGLGAFFTIHL